MVYQLRNGEKINLDSLTRDERNFITRAKKKLRTNEEWLKFDEWALGMNSPIYKCNKHSDIAKEPVFIVLKDISLRLGIKQGKIAKIKTKKGKKI